MARVRIKLSRDELQAVAAQSAGKLVLSATRRTLNRARVLSPWDTGNLRASHTMLIRSLKRKRAVGRVSTRVKYALAVHDGTKPHVIRPKRRKALKFKYRGRTVIVRKVNHPGTEARPWLRQAMREVAQRQGFSIRRVGPGAS